MASITKQILGGLEYLHNMHFVHRELSTEKIWFAKKLLRESEDGSNITVKIANLGTATHIAPTPKEPMEHHKTGVYVSPEIIRASDNP